MYIAFKTLVTSIILRRKEGRNCHDIILSISEPLSVSVLTVVLVLAGLVAVVIDDVIMGEVDLSSCTY
jgi:hypothetical protein